MYLIYMFCSLITNLKSMHKYQAYSWFCTYHICCLKRDKLFLAKLFCPVRLVLLYARMNEALCFVLHNLQRVFCITSSLMFANGDHMGLESLIFSLAILFTCLKYFSMLLIFKVWIKFRSYLYIDDFSLDCESWTIE